MPLSRSPNFVRFVYDGDDSATPLAAPAPITALRAFSAAAPASAGVTMEYLGDELQR